MIRLLQQDGYRTDAVMSEAAKSSGLGAGHGLPVEERELQARFVADNLKRIFLQIYRIVGNVEDAQDLTQETFIKALQRQEQIRDTAKAAHWLSRVASNTAIDYLRRHGRLTFTAMDEAGDLAHPEHEQSPEWMLLRAEESALLQDGLSTLSVRERTALVLRDVEGLSAADVADELRCSKATVRSHIANARVKFRRFLQSREQGREI